MPRSLDAIAARRYGAAVIFTRLSLVDFKRSAQPFRTIKFSNRDTLFSVTLLS